MLYHPRQRKSVQQRLIERLRRVGVDLPDGVTLCRTWAGYWQRSEGAWSWTAVGPDGHGELNIGSQWPMKLLLAAPRLDTSISKSGDTHIDPVDEQGCPWYGPA